MFTRLVPLNPLIPLFLFVLLLFSLSLNFIQWQQDQRRNIVTSVPDGDSLDLADGRRVRLLGIDAPERGRCMADQARLYLTQLAKGKHVRLKETLTDDYGRMLAMAILDEPGTWLQYLRLRFFPSDPLDPSASLDPLLNRAMLFRGLARSTGSASGQYHQVLTDVQEVAKAANLGIWSDLCRAKTPGNDDCAIKGNTRAGEKRYYLPVCKQYDQVVVDTAFGDAWFCSETQAQTVGFTKALGCPSGLF